MTTIQTFHNRTRRPSDFSQTITLDGVVYKLRITWNTRSQKWYMDILTTNNQNILLGIGLVPQIYLLDSYPIPSLPPGDFVLMDSLSTPEAIVPGFADLGNRYKLIYFSEVQVISMKYLFGDIPPVLPKETEE